MDSRLRGNDGVLSLLLPKLPLREEPISAVLEEHRERTQMPQKKYGSERKRRKTYAEVAKGIPNLFKNALNQCLCGLQAINGWEGAWGLLVSVLVCFGLLSPIKKKATELLHAFVK